MKVTAGVLSCPEASSDPSDLTASLDHMSSIDERADLILSGTKDPFSGYNRLCILLIAFPRPSVNARQDNCPIAR